MATFEKHELQQMEGKGLPQLDEKLQSMDELEKIQLRNENARLQKEIAQLKNENGVAANKKELLEAEVARLTEINADMKTTMSEQQTKISNLEKKHIDEVEKKVMEAKIAFLEAESDKDFKVLDVKKKSSGFMFVEKMQNIARLPFTTISYLTTKKLSSSKLPIKDPNVIKRLIKQKNGRSFHAYLTLDDNEKPMEICKKRYYPYSLYINGLVSDSKKMVLDGLVSFFDVDPFNGKAGYYAGDDSVFSNLLEYVHSCNITDLFLHKQVLSLEDYEKLTKSGTIKNLYFSDIKINNEYDDSLVQLENVMEKLPNIEKFVYDVAGSHICVTISSVFSVGKETSKNLVKLPCFKNLKFFKLYNIISEVFDAIGFVNFMKKYPQTHFTLSFYCDWKSDMLKLEAVKQKLLQSYPYPEKLTVQFKKE